MDEAISVLQKGGIVLYPTDTVYGLGVDAMNAKAIRHLQELKERGEQKPISIAVSDLEMAKKYAVVTPLAQKLAEKFIPGKLTLVLTAKNILPSELTAGTGTVGIRIPDHPIARALVKGFGKPITATSANITDMPSLNSVPEILTQFGKKSVMIYHNDIPQSLPPSEPSTVVDARGETPVILRVGAVSERAIKASVDATPPHHNK